MPIRQATWPDLLPASKLLAKAFHDDYLFGTFAHPRRNEFPDDVYLYWLRFLREAFVTIPGEYLVVSYCQAESDARGVPAETITGIAHWIRNYSEPPPTSWSSTLALKAMESYNKFEDLIWKNRAIDHSHDAVLPLGNPFFEHHWSGSRADSWHLSLLGVNPAHARQGYGRQLVQWGFERSLEESVSCSVISVPGQERFYRGCGFDKLVGTTNDEGADDNAWKAAGLEAAPILFCDHGAEPLGLRMYGDV